MCWAENTRNTVAIARYEVMLKDIKSRLWESSTIAIVRYKFTITRSKVTIARCKVNQKMFVGEAFKCEILVIE